MKKFGFTLSEVLITLAIIGVVAAMTVPTVITKYNNSENAARTKKLYGVVSSAIEEALKESGGNRITEQSLENAINSTLRVKNLGNCFGYAVKRIGGSTYSSNLCTTRVYQLPDGSIFGRETANNSSPWIYIDGNGKKGPNTFGRDLYLFTLDPENGTIKGFDYDDCDPNHSGYHGWGCSKRLIQSGWEIDW